jgi:hypothetical protein
VSCETPRLRGYDAADDGEETLLRRSSDLGRATDAGMPPAEAEDDSSRARDGDAESDYGSAGGHTGMQSRAVVDRMKQPSAVIPESSS